MSKARVPTGHSNTGEVDTVARSASQRGIAERSTTCRGRCWRAFKYLVGALLAALGLYALILLVGLIPVNNGFKPTPDGVEIFLISNPVHADVVLPIETEAIDWREQFPADAFAGDTSHATHVAIGWGDTGFFLETPTWADLRVSTAARALFWPSSSCLHVDFTKAEYLGEEARSVTISKQQYEQLVGFILTSFRTGDDGGKLPVGSYGYTQSDAFFDAHGRYHCLNTCNSWVGRALWASGVRTGWLTPLPKTVFLYLPD